MNDNLKNKSLVVNRTMDRIMVLKGGSPAYHKLGDIGRERDEFINVYSEVEDRYIGIFEEGFGFIDVEFNKTDCRALTEEEVYILNTKVRAVNGVPLLKVRIDKDGNSI